MIINFKNKVHLAGGKKKNIISNIRVDKQVNFLAYLLFSGRKKDHLDMGGSYE
ncbi:hypothetical protein [uncultured Anaerococcus sp.]|uniref:hypothetical protein n=1 Tax=uncultured Anaerococcus sp. TaxID=293428 RepID=UPI00288C57C6|nr:hypothetical protein [uncultured Anaerococcus sp.]